jgi:tripartite-type tricarboxylate transporter receptor subunit TctC
LSELASRTHLLPRRSALRVAASLISLYYRPTQASANVPALRLLAPGAGGSMNDAEARAFVPFLERHLPPADVTIVNLPGQGGLACYRALADAPADGATLGWAATPNLPARCIDGPAPELLGRLKLIGALQSEPIVLVAPSGGAGDVAAFRHLASAGEPFGTALAGSPSHLAALRLQELIGIRLNLVVFPSPAAARQAVVAGNVASATLALGEAVVPLREGRIEGIGLAAERRLAEFPDLPTLSAGGLPLVATILRGIAAPAGMATADITRLAASLRAVTEDPEFAAQATTHGFESVWLDGTAWTERTELERQALTQLWQRAPWRDGSG